MNMTRKDYVAIADLIDELYSSGECDNNTLEEVARGIARLCARGNERFDRIRFLEACGIEVQS